MFIAHRIRLVPTRSQEEYFVRACGVARFTYNWALAEWKRQFEAGEKPSVFDLRRKLNAIKGAKFPWMQQVTKNAQRDAIGNVGRAFRNYFMDLEKHRAGRIKFELVRIPRFKKKGSADRFRADPGTEKRFPNGVQVNGKWVKLPFAGWVRMREEVRFIGRILSVTVLRRAGSWYASFCIEVEYEPDIRSDDTTVGVDLGVEYLATLSDGSPKIPAPKPLGAYLKKLRRLSRAFSRKKRGSCNRVKAKAKLARLHQRIANIRTDALHKVTTRLVRYRTIVIEDLSVRNLLGNRRMSRAISDIGFFEFRRQLNYKAAMAGSTVIAADRWFPSSKLCSNCDAVSDNLALSNRVWVCSSCGAHHDRDINAAYNLARYAESSPASACGVEGSGGEDISLRNRRRRNRKRADL